MGKKRCPHCGAKDPIEILYGMIPDISKVKDQRIKMGGCVITPDSPKYACGKCNKRYGKLG